MAGITILGIWILLFVLLLLFGAGVGIYLYCFLRRILKTFGFWKKTWRHRVGVLLAVLVIFGICAASLNMGAVILIHILMFAVLMDLVSLLLRALFRSRYKEEFLKWRRIVGSGLVPVLLTVLMIGYGYYNMHHVVATEYTITTGKSIREEGYKLILIADVHYGISLDLEQLKEVRDRIDMEQADAVILCGDIVDDATTYEEMQEAVAVLGSMQSQYGIFYVFGNHDRPFSFAEDASEYTEEQLVDALEDAGVRILKDEVYEMTEDFTIVGRDDRSFSYRASLESLLLKADPEDFILTLDHQPNEYVINAQSGTDLLLSGHTHGGQIWPLNILMEIIPFNDGVYGHYRLDDDSQAIVTSGLAGWMFPIKTAAPAEYAVIEIVSE